ncbi:MAG: hypothetical protein ABJH63_14025 [Rhizobiaceae bacterium]
MSISLATMSLPAQAGSDAWYTTPERQGDCGDECYTAPHAWIDEANGRHAYGISCDSTMVLGGPAMEVSQIPFTKAHILIDGKSMGVFSIDSGLNDVFVSPAEENELTHAQVQAALEAGRRFQLKVEGRSPIKFNLRGSRAAIRSMMKACQQ